MLFVLKRNLLVISDMIKYGFNTSTIFCGFLLLGSFFVGEFESNGQTFFLDSNGVTVKCEDCEPGDQGEVNGILYTAADRSWFDNNLIANYYGFGQPLSTICTTLMDDMSHLFPNDFSCQMIGNGNMAHWDVSNVTDMSNMFSTASGPYEGYGCEIDSLNSEGLKYWDVSNVINMSNMFNGVSLSPCPNSIMGWDVSNVIDMSGMFLNFYWGCGGYWYQVNGYDTGDYITIPQLDLGEWDVSSVTSMVAMFRECSTCLFGHENWDVSNVLDMSNMFNSSDDTLFSGSLLSNWDVSNVTHMEFMFRNANADLSDLSSWDVSSVESMRGMFAHSNFQLPLGLANWETSSLTNLERSFEEVNLHDDISSWDVSNVTNFEYAFFLTEFGTTTELNEWDMSGAESLKAMFWSSGFNQELNQWDVSGVLDMYGMFAGSDCAFNKDIGMWDVGDVVDFRGMFNGNVNFNQDISSWDTQDAYYMDYMFEDAEAFDQDLSSWCQPNIPLLPEGFATNCPMPESHYPFWGDDCLGTTDEEGCTDVLACNYDPQATSDDGSCEYVETFTIEGDATPDALVELIYSYPNNEGSGYEWSITGGVIDSGQGTNSVTVLWATEGLQELAVTETNEDGCEGELVTLNVIVSSTGISEDEFEKSSFSVHPNPSSTVIYLDTDLPELKQSPVWLLSSRGEIVVKQDVSPSLVLDVSEVNSGLYLLVWGSFTQKVLIQ